MKLNKQKWIQEVRRVEAEIRSFKTVMHDPEQQGKFSHADLFRLKAEATRLYLLRRVMKQKALELKSFYYLKQSGKYTWAYRVQVGDLTAETITTLILDSIPGWKNGFLLDEPIVALPPQDAPLMEAVVSQLV
jgi:hypothetical protein